MDVQAVEGGGEQSDDVLGPVEEVTADASQPAVVRDDAAAVAEMEAEQM